jgi:hypothetical protein
MTGYITVKKINIKSIMANSNLIKANNLKTEEVWLALDHYHIKLHSTRLCCTKVMLLY